MNVHMYPAAAPPAIAYSPPTVIAYAPPPPPAPVQAAPTIVQVAAPSQVGPRPSMVTCSSCQKSVMTNVKYKAVGKTHMWACFLFLIGCWPCCCIPYCMDTCRNADHYCPGCNSYIGAYRA